MHIYPVIHHATTLTSLDQAALAFEVGADGVFLISHDGADEDLPGLANTIKERNPDKHIGVNLLQAGPLVAHARARQFDLDMVWLDQAGVSSNQIAPQANDLHEQVLAHPALRVFVGVAFKYQAPELDPAAAAIRAAQLGFVPTTSGTATGSAPSLQKIQRMSEGLGGGNLAVASGLSAENIQAFAPYVTHALVASAVSRDMHHFDYERLAQFVSLAKAGARVAAI